MTKDINKFTPIAILALAGLLISFSVKADAVDAEMSQVTLFVEGMMKSRGGVT